MSQIFQRIADRIGSFVFQCGKNPLNGTEAEALISRVTVSHRGKYCRIFRNLCQCFVYHNVPIFRSTGTSEYRRKLVLPLVRNMMGCNPGI
jgi:hypothetical protein